MADLHVYQDDHDTWCASSINDAIIALLWPVFGVLYVALVIWGIVSA